MIKSGFRFFIFWETDAWDYRVTLLNLDSGELTSFCFYKKDALRFYFIDNRLFVRILKHREDEPEESIVIFNHADVDILSKIAHAFGERKNLSNADEKVEVEVTIKDQQTKNDVGRAKAAKWLLAIILFCIAVAVVVTVAFDKDSQLPPTIGGGNELSDILKSVPTSPPSLLSEPKKRSRLSHSEG